MAHHFFEKIQDLSANDTFNNGNLISTAASHFNFEINSAEAQSEVAALGNFKSVGFTHNRNKIIIVDPQVPSLAVSYLMFCSITNRFDFGKYTPDRSRLPQNMFSSPLGIVLPSVSTDAVISTIFTKTESDLSHWCRRSEIKQMVIPKTWVSRI